MSMFFNPLQSLFYNPGIGVFGSPHMFSAKGIYANYILTEQQFQFTAFNLKPVTFHKLFLDNIDITPKAKQQGRLLGEGLLSDKFGRIIFSFYFSSDLIPGTAAEKAAAMAQLLAGVKKLEIRSDDGKSSSYVHISVPSYIKEEPIIDIKKVPLPSSTSESIKTNLVIQESPQTGLQPGQMYFTPGSYDYVQTFYADPEIVNKSKEISITSVDLYIKSKPNSEINTSGTTKPSITIAICDVENGIPVISKCYASSISEKQYDEIYSYADASTPTTFGLPEQLKLNTGRFYGIVVIFGDAQYDLWSNVTGDKLVGTNTPSPGSNIVKDGNLFARNNSNVFTARMNEDLKFNVNIARYVFSNTNIIFTNKNYEFFTIENKVGSFIGGEYVYKDVAKATGAVTVTKGSDLVIGTSTSFSTLAPGQPIVIYANSTVSQVNFIKNVANNTVMTMAEIMPFSVSGGDYKITAVGKVYFKDEINNKLYLVDSTAGNIAFASTNLIIGEDSRASANIASIDPFNIDRINLKGSIRTPVQSQIKTTLAAAAFDGTNYEFFEAQMKLAKINNTTVQNIKDYDAYILSRSQEITNSNLYSNTDLLIDRKSLKISVDLINPTANCYFAPTIENNKLDLYAIQNIVSNNYTTTSSGVVIDTEVFGNGTAQARHIGTKVSFNNGRFAEDVKMFMTAYRPLGTELKVYARLHNSQDPEAFDDKAWTPLEYKTNAGKYSSSIDSNDFVEYELGLPQYGETANSLPGTFKTSYLNSTLLAQGVVANSYVVSGDLIKLYSSLFPDNYVVAPVISSNTTAIVINSPISTNNVVGDGYRVDRLKYKNTAFNDINNTNISKYYNTTMAEFDKFDSMQIKIVMLADTTFLVPKIDQIQVIGVSA